MLEKTKAFPSFSVNDLEKAGKFYGQTLGLDVKKTAEGLDLKLPGSGHAFIYSKPNHKPASFTVLNFLIDDIESTVKDLGRRGVVFEHYKEKEVRTDEKGIHRDEKGPIIAWFKDPAGNILSVVQEKQA